MKTSQSTTPIRELMPDKFIPKIVAKAKARLGETPGRSAISNAVNDERVGTKYWEDIEAVAREHNPIAFEQRVAYLNQLKQQFQAA